MVKTQSSVNFGTLSEGGVCRTALENSFCEIIVCANRGKNQTKEMALFKADTKLGVFYLFFLLCLGVCSHTACFSFLFTQPLSRLHTISHKHTFFPLFPYVLSSFPSGQACASEICVHYQMKDEKNQQRTPPSETEISDQNFSKVIPKSSSSQKDVQEENVPCWKIQIKSS